MDGAFPVHHQALPPERIIGVETGCCPHTVIREDASINLEPVDRLWARFPQMDAVFVESGGHNLAATFSPELSDLAIYVIDVAAGDKIPRKGGPGSGQGLDEIVAFIETRGMLVCECVPQTLARTAAR